MMMHDDVTMPSPQLHEISGDERRDGYEREDHDMREAPDDDDYDEPQRPAAPWYSPWGWGQPSGLNHNNSNNNQPLNSRPQTSNNMNNLNVGPFVRVVSRGAGDVRSTHSGDDDDCREEDLTMEREGGNTDDDAHCRIHEPLKRYQWDGDYDQGNKRRRIGEAASMSFYRAIPALTERQQALVEYVAPSGLTPLFKVLGYTSFAVTWVMVMYFFHTIQTLLSTFGDETKSMRLKPWIPPLLHHLMDTYIWNHSMITLMLLYPDLFGDTAYWLAVFFVVAQQQGYLIVSLKTHYVKRYDTVKNECRRDIELRFVDCFLLYALADVCFILSKLLGIRYILYMGLVEFNLAPLYVVWAYKKRMDAATIIMVGNEKHHVSGGDKECNKGDKKEK